MQITNDKTNRFPQGQRQGLRAGENWRRSNGQGCFRADVLRSEKGDQKMRFSHRINKR